MRDSALMECVLMTWWLRQSEFRERERERLEFVKERHRGGGEGELVLTMTCDLIICFSSTAHPTNLKIHLLRGLHSFVVIVL